MFRIITTHKRPHLDEICAIMMLMMAGKKLFPGIETAKVVFEGSGGESLRGIEAKTWEEEGVLPVGVGGGRFDEHPGPGLSKKEGECTTTLVAKALGIDRAPVWEKIIRFVTNSDLKAGGNPFDLAQLVKDMHQTNPENPQKVFDWAVAALEAKFKVQLAFMVAQRNLEKNTKKEEVRLPNGNTVVIATAVTSDESFNKAARANGAGVVIQQQDENATLPLVLGNVQIFIDKRISGLKLYNVISLLRTEEARVQKRTITTDQDELRAEGKMAGAQEWYFHDAGQFIFNGCSTTSNEPTKLSLEKIRHIVCQGISSW